MPVYTYRCDHCSEEIEKIRKIADRDNDLTCGLCHGPARRKIDSPGSVWAPTSTNGGMKV